VHGPGYAGGGGRSNCFRQEFDIADDWHTYAIDWNEDRIQWSFDDQMYFELGSGDLGRWEWVFDQPFFIILGWPTAGRSAGSSTPSSSTPSSTSPTTSVCTSGRRARSDVQLDRPQDVDYRYWERSWERSQDDSGEGVGRASHLRSHIVEPTEPVVLDRAPQLARVSRDPRVGALLDRMTLPEKAGQMTQVELGSIGLDDVAAWAVGSVLSGGGGNPGDGTAGEWRASVEAFVDASRASRLGIPILYGTDAVHGHNNVLGATIFPHNIGLGATADPDLTRRVMRAAALETAATGARWSFAPCLAVPQDVRWGRTYEGFSQDSDLVAALGRAAVEGWHGDDLPATGVLACAKHYVGEGAMVWGTAGSHRHDWIDWWDGWGAGWQIDQGDIRIDEEELRRVHLPPFVAAIEAGALSVMACYGTWHGRRLHEDPYLLSDVLKDELGFEGFVVSDWMAIDQIDPDHATAVERAIRAGIDMVMVPFDYQRFISTVVALVEDGRIPVERIDDAVGRILGAKARLGLLDDPQPTVPLDVIGCDEHRVLAGDAVQASAVVLSDAGVLPISEDASILAAGEALDDIGIACGGWTISWTGSPGDITPGRTIVDGLRDIVGERKVQYEREGRFTSTHASIGIVSVHELPYVEGGGDRSNLWVPAEQIDVVRRVRDLVDRLVVVVISGRPLLLKAVLEHADAVVACWLPGSESNAIADVLMGRAPFSGRLPVAWPRSEAQITGGAELVPGLSEWPVGHPVGALSATTRTGGG
jgi:beta-glucosidase